MLSLSLYYTFTKPIDHHCQRRRVSYIANLQVLNPLWMYPRGSRCIIKGGEGRKIDRQAKVVLFFKSLWGHCYIQRHSFYVALSIDISNRAEHKKLTQTAPGGPFGFIFEVQFGLEIQALITFYFITIVISFSSRQIDMLTLMNLSICLP